MKSKTPSICFSQSYPETVLRPPLESLSTRHGSRIKALILSAMQETEGSETRQFSPSRKSHELAGLRLETTATPQLINSNGTYDGCFESISTRPASHWR